jgi:hypothetical protein
MLRLRNLRSATPLRRRKILKQEITEISKRGFRFYRALAFSTQAMAAGPATRSYPQRDSRDLPEHAYPQEKSGSDENVPIEGQLWNRRKQGVNLWVVLG